MQSEVKQALDLGKKIIFADETMFTTATVLSHAYSHKKSNIEIDQALMNNEALAVVAGVSAEAGLESYMIRKGAIDSESFIDFLRTVQERNPATPVAIFMDNASFHRSKVVTAYLKESGIQAIFNLPYSPQYNPIERVWALVKNRYKRRKLEKVGGGQQVDHEKIVRESVEGVSGDTIRNICKKVVINNILKT